MSGELPRPPEGSQIAVRRDGDAVVYEWSRGKVGGGECLCLGVGVVVIALLPLGVLAASGHTATAARALGWLAGGFALLGLVGQVKLKPGFVRIEPDSIEVRGLKSWGETVHRARRDEVLELSTGMTQDAVSATFTRASAHVVIRLASGEVLVGTGLFAGREAEWLLAVLRCWKERQLGGA